MVSRTTNGRHQRTVVQAARRDLVGRHGNFDVVEVDDEVPNRLGQVPLEVLYFVVDRKGQKLIPDPEHSGIQMTEEY